MGAVHSALALKSAIFAGIFPHRILIFDRETFDAPRRNRRASGAEDAEPFFSCTCVARSEKIQRGCSNQRARALPDQ
jgi:hypothetical protein